jgi:L-alanine-DL-glutamate epimerase-like enolase superfamily enzyme
MTHRVSSPPSIDSLRKVHANREAFGAQASYRLDRNGASVVADRRTTATVCTSGRSS